MTQIETLTTHTVKLSWAANELISKGELIAGLKDALPDGADITRLAVTNEANAELCAASTQTLTITYVTSPMLDRFRR